MAATQEHLRTVYKERVGRQDAIRIVDRGGDYVVHAATQLRPGVHATACGRSMHFVLDIARETEPNCMRCRKVLGLPALT